MKNKGRRNTAHGFPELMNGIENCKGCLTHITRPIESMSSKGFGKGRFDKKKWSKRVRGYFKSQTKDILAVVLFLLLSLTTHAQIKMPFGSHGDSLYVWVEQISPTLTTGKGTMSNNRVDTSLIWQSPTNVRYSPMSASTTRDTLIKGHTLAPGYVFRDSDKVAAKPTYTQFIAPIVIALPNGHHSYMNMDSTWHIEDTLLTIKALVKWQMEIRRNYDNQIGRLYKIIAIQQKAINKTLGILNRQRKIIKKKK